MGTDLTPIVHRTSVLTSKGGTNFDLAFLTSGGDAENRTIYWKMQVFWRRYLLCSLRGFHVDGFRLLLRSCVSEQNTIAMDSGTVPVCIVAVAQPQRDNWSDNLACGLSVWVCAGLPTRARGSGQWSMPKVSGQRSTISNELSVKDECPW